MRFITGFLILMVSLSAESADNTRLYCEGVNSNGEKVVWYLWLDLSSRPKVVTIKNKALDVESIRIIVNASDEYISGVDKSTDYVTWRSYKRYFYLDRYSLELDTQFEEWTSKHGIIGEDSLKQPRMVLKESFNGNCRRLIKQI
jgi:hypothetical protein